MSPGAFLALNGSAILGTPGYMAPEQRNSDLELGRRQQPVLDLRRLAGHQPR